MKLASFITLTMLAVLYAVLTVTEGTAFKSWQRTLADQRDIQGKVVRFQRLNAATEELLKRLAVDSQRDPALAELLKRHDIHVTIKPLDSTSGLLTPNPAATEKPASAPSTSTPPPP